MERITLFSLAIIAMAVPGIFGDVTPSREPLQDSESRHGAELPILMSTIVWQYTDELPDSHAWNSQTNTDPTWQNSDGTTPIGVRTSTWPQHPKSKKKI